jgi:hypothetical protein
LYINIDIVNLLKMILQKFYKVNKWNHFNNAKIRYLINTIKYLHNDNNNKIPITNLISYIVKKIIIFVIFIKDIMLEVVRKRDFLIIFRSGVQVGDRIIA